MRALGSFAGVDGEPVLAAGCGDGSVRLWSALSGEPLGDPPTGYSPVQGLAACEVGGVPWLTTGDEDGVVRTWSPLDAEVFEFERATGRCEPWRPSSGGALFVATAGSEHDVRVWHEGRKAAVLVGEAPIRALAAHSMPGASR